MFLSAKYKNVLKCHYVMFFLLKAHAAVASRIPQKARPQIQYKNLVQ